MQSPLPVPLPAKPTSGMHLKSLYLRHFRNYEQAHFTFSPKLNLIQGRNGQGKTNLLEAIYLLSTGRSFRTLHLAELIQSGAPFFYIEAHFVKDEISQTVTLTFDGKARKMQYNNTSSASFTPLLGLLPSILYAPSDAQLISGAPCDRRRFLDLHIAQSDPLYVHHLTRYFKALKQRNTLLRQRKEETLDAWEQMMAHSADYLVKKRSEAIVELEEPLWAWMQRFSNSEDGLDITYRPSNLSDFCALFKKNRRKELLLGSTLAGPHRDDLLLAINGQEAKLFASEGQKRCAIAALRFAEWQRFQTLFNTQPLLGIDDFGAHLDEQRTSLLQEQLAQKGQVFLTSPQFSPNLSSLANTASFFVEKNKI